MSPTFYQKSSDQFLHMWHQARTAPPLKLPPTPSKYIRGSSSSRISQVIYLCCLSIYLCCLSLSMSLVNVVISHTHTDTHINTHAHMKEDSILETTSHNVYLRVETLSDRVSAAHRKSVDATGNAFARELKHVFPLSVFSPDSTDSMDLQIWVCCNCVASVLQFVALWWWLLLLLSKVV